MNVPNVNILRNDHMIRLHCARYRERGWKSTMKQCVYIVVDYDPTRSQARFRWYANSKAYHEDAGDIHFFSSRKVKLR